MARSTARVPIFCARGRPGVTVDSSTPALDCEPRAPDAPHVQHVLPPRTARARDAAAILETEGYVALGPAGLAELLGDGADPRDPIGPFAAFWEDLPPDEHLLDSGGYRLRRHGSFIVEAGRVRPVEHRAHWQPLDYNALHGGIERWFAPLDGALVALPLWSRLLAALTERAAALHADPGPWFVEAHAIRITTASGIGRPTPEGAHRDGVDLVAVLLVGREGVKGGETRVFEADGPRGERFTMTERGTTLLIDDARAIHESTPIQPESPDVPGHRDTLVLTWRRGGFQEPPPDGSSAG